MMSTFIDNVRLRSFCQDIGNDVSECRLIRPAQHEKVDISPLKRSYIVNRHACLSVILLPGVASLGGTMSRHARIGDPQSARRRLAVISAVLVTVVSCAAAYMSFAIQATASSAAWSSAEEVPGTAALNLGGSATIESISCAAAGNCSAGGAYTDSSGNGQAFVVSEVNGTWGAAEEVPGTASLNQGGNAQIRSVSCASAGNCSAGGLYADTGTNKFEAFVVSEVNGTWGTAEEVPGTSSLNEGAQAAIYSVSCPSAGNCGAGGYYTDGSNHWQAFVVSEADGTWANAVEVPGMSTLNFGLGQTASVSCASAGNCSAGGFYNDSALNDQAFVVDEVNGTWGTAEEVPGTAALDQGEDAEIRSVSCASAGNCSAGGRYTDSSHRFQVFVVDEVNGAWGTASQVPGTATLNQGEGADFGSVSCASAGNCSAGGVYYDSSSRAQVFVVNEVGGTWGTAEEVPGTAALNTGGNDAIAAVSCASAANCSAGGIYYDNSSHGHAFVVDEVSGTWATAEEVPGSAALDQGQNADLNSLSCAPQGECSAGGFYTDASGHTQAFVVGQAATQSSATALNLSTATVTYGDEQAEQVSVMVSSAGTPTGTVTVTAGASTLCTITLASAAGSCTLQATQLTAGTYQVTGSYSGDANTSPSTSPAQTLTVTVPSLAILSPATKSGPAGTLVQWKASGLKSGLSLSEFVVSSNGQSYRLGSYTTSSSGDIYGQYIIPCTAKPKTSWTFELSAPNVLLEDSFTVTTGTAGAECTGLGAGLIPYPIHVRPLTSAQLSADLSFLETTLQGIADLHLNIEQYFELAGLTRAYANCAPAPSWYNVNCDLFLVSAIKFLFTVEPAS